MTHPRGKNRLQHSNSPYLLQHAGNPVDWYEWGEEAFKAARDQDKPVFLSIGYSTCHWCHVMAHESFENEQIARLMNDAFINVKVDREERPDIDQVYMAVCQLFSPSCGWPLTVLLTPEKKPFFVATYLPRESAFGRTGMLDLIPLVKEKWQNGRDEILASAESIHASVNQFVSSSSSSAAAVEVRPDLVEKAYRAMKQSWDPVRGGFGRAPKFPMPLNLLFLMRYWHAYGVDDALLMVENSLVHMRNGGVFDHVGFGFHRYSTDADWFLPHFEKMLYDQALLTMAYTEAYQATGKNLYRRVVEEICEYLFRDLRSPEGAFYAAEDADSEGEEGRFYVWSYNEISDHFSPDETGFLERHYGLSRAGNAYDEASGQATGTNILFGDTSEDGAQAQRFEEIRPRLLELRNKRVRPGRDDKILTDWNGLAIAALAKAGRALENSEYVEAAASAAAFHRTHMMAQDGSVLHSYRDRKTGSGSFASDYMFFAWGLLELYQATGDPDYLAEATALADSYIARFHDETGGGFFFTPAEGEELIVRSKEVYDGAIPSANSVSLLVFHDLYRLTGREQYGVIAGSVPAAFAETLVSMPEGYACMMTGLQAMQMPGPDVVICGDSRDETVRKMLAALSRMYMPDLQVIRKDPSRDNSALHDLAPFLRHMTAIGGMATAYVCRDHACRQPVHTVDELLAALKEKG